MRIVHKNKKMIPILFVVALLVGGAIGWTFFRDTNPALSGEDRTIDYGPPTDDEAKAGDDIKPRIVEDNETQQPSSTTAKKPVQVGVTIADQYDTQVEVRAFVQGVIEGTGTCIATFTQEGVTVTASSKAFVDATTSQCKPIYIDRSKFPAAGIWQLVVSYDSPGYTGKSEGISVTIK